MTWRQGRCLPYGDGIAFWALGEIVKAECGILESDSPQEAEAKLERALPPDDPDRPWLKARLEPLVGAGGEPTSQEESFTAWRRFLESLAAEGPAVLVFEDLHWADRAVLSFLEHLADWSEGVPLLLLCTARPELYEKHASWAAGLRNATTINLAALSQDETALLIASLLERAVLPAETQQALLERAGGNPLYAEEFVRLLADRGRLGETEDVPDSVQALIAARLDTLSPERKSLLQDGAVIGKVFWAGALAEMSGRELREVEQALHELARKELVRSARISSMEREAEYGFWHVLVRDVCYAQIPRAARAARHHAAASWIERKAGDRAEDLADVLAHHYLSALDLARAAGDTEHLQELEGQAGRYLALAGERSLPLDVDRAEQTLARALALAPAGGSQRAFVLERWAQAVQQQGRLKAAKDALEEALIHHRDLGDTLAAGRVLVALSRVLQRLGDPSKEEIITEALTLLEARPPGPELVDAYGRLATFRWLGGAHADAIVVAERALALAAELDLPEPAAVLGARGGARSDLGERQGLADMRRALELAVEQGQGREAAILQNNLSFAVWQYEGLDSALTVCREGVDFCERRGMTEMALPSAATAVTLLAGRGLTDEALLEAGPLAERMQEGSDIFFIEPRSLQLRLLAERGAGEDAPAVDEVVVRARESGEPQLYAEAFSAASRLLLVQGRPQQARQLLLELDPVVGIRDEPIYATVLAELVRTALALGEPALAVRLVEGVESGTPLAEHALTACRALLAETASDHIQAATIYAEAAERWREFGNVPERAYALLGQARCLVALDRREADPLLRETHDLFAAMGYKPALAEVEALLTQTAAAPAS